MKSKSVVLQREEDLCCSCSAEPRSDPSKKGPEKEPSGGAGLKPFLFSDRGGAIASFLLLMVGIIADNFWQPAFFNGWLRVAWYGLAYLPVGFPVMLKAARTISRGEVFTEFFLMCVATIGAFVIGEYPEGVAVMLFYAVGELFQGAAVKRAKRNITALLDVRPDSASVLRGKQYETVDPREVAIGETVMVKAGEKVPLDGILLSDSSSFNTLALTGESKPRTLRKGEQVLAGMVNMHKVIEVETNRKFADSSIAHILDLVQNATAKKAKTEQFIRRFAKVYTPAVTFLAIALAFLPYFFVENYVLETWLYRALVFLVVSCPCALVISIPLGYFGGIGAASRNGILFKGSNYLDLMTRVNTVVMDKTGTLTEGVFEVQKVSAAAGEFDPKRLLELTAALESRSRHPVAEAIGRFAVAGGIDFRQATVGSVEEIAGHGLKGKVGDMEVLAGNARLLKKFGVPFDPELERIVDTVVMVAVGGRYAGHIIIADRIKEDAKEAVRQMHRNGVRTTVMLSGDKQAVVENVARTLGIDSAFGDLLPEGKVQKVEELKRDPEKVIAFVGDGINDAPVLAMSDVGIAMGGLGSDAAIETADVVIQTDQPSKIPRAIRIGKQTRRIVWQNIALAFGVKLIVLALGAGGLATMWEAVFADVGVALLAILNAVRIQNMNA